MRAAGCCALLLWAAVAGAEGVEWTAVPVRAPVAPEEVSALPPYVPLTAVELAGKVEVGPSRGAAFWLPGLEVVQLRADPGTLRFHRLTGGQRPTDAWLRVEEPGVPVRAGVWYLHEPVGQGSVWVVTATRPTALQVEKPGLPQGPRADEDLRAAVLAWVDGLGPPPPLPFHARLRHQLVMEAELGETLLRGMGPEDGLHRAVRAWRKASALKALWTVQSLEGEALRTRWHSPPGSAVAFDGFVRPFSRVSPEGAWAAEVEGPGVLVVDARAVWGEGARPDPIVVVEDEAGRLLAEASPPVRSARLGERGALPGLREARTLSPGESVGPGEELRVPLSPGRQLVRVRWHGGAVLLRTRVVNRRPSLMERWRGVADWPGWAEQARAGAAASPAPAARLLERLVSSLDATSMQAQDAAARPMPRSHVPLTAGARHPLLVQLQGQPPELRALGALELAADLRDARARRGLAEEAKAAFADGWLEAGSELAWALRLRTCQLLLDVGLPSDARELLRGPARLPASGHLVAQAAEVLLGLPGGTAWRSRALGAFELAHRQEPLALDLRQRYRAAFFRHGRWSALSPLPGDDRPRPLPGRWLDLEPVEDDAAPGSGAHFPLLPGQVVRIPGASGPDGARVLRAFVLTARAGDGPPVLHVGPLRIPVLPLSPVEPVEVALPQGEHRVHLEAPEGTRAWLSIGPAQGMTGPTGEVAYLRTHFPARARGRSLAFPVPDAQVPGPVRLQLRAVSGDGQPVGMWIRTDVGQPRRVELHPGQPSARHLSVDERPGPGSAAATLLLHLPAHARELWLEPDDPDAQLYVSVAVRRGPRTPEELLAGRRPSPEEPDEARLARLLELSRALARDPDSAGALLERAALLLDVGEEGLARDDLVRALARQKTLTEAEGEALAVLLEKVESDAQDLGRFARPPDGPMLLYPGSAALGASDGAQAEVARRVRGLPHDEALAALGEGASALERYVRARLLAARRAPEGAALELLRLYRETDHPALGMDALFALERVQSLPTAWTEWGAPMGVALTSQLAAVVDLPAVRRVRNDARRFARWQRLRDADTQAGTLDLLRAPEDEPRERLLLALHAPPWPLPGTRVLTLGQAAVLDWEVHRPLSVGVEAVCQAVRADVRPPGEPCAFALRLDNQEVARARAAVGQVVMLRAELLPGGRHQLELVFDARVAASAASRFVALGPSGAVARALEAEAPMPVLRARPGVPVEVTALGPTAVRLEARAFGRDGQLTVRDGEGRPPRVLLLSAMADAGVKGAPFVVGHPSEVLLLLPEAGPHRLRFEAVGGEALVRVGLGGTRRPTPRRAEWWTRAPTALEPLPWPALPEPLALLPPGGQGALRRNLGTLSAELGMAGEYLDEGELDRPVEGRLRARLAWRQELSPRRAWLMVAPEMRHPLDRNGAYGGGAALHLRRLPLDLRATLSGGVFTQTLDGGLRYAARARGSVDRWIGLAPDLGIIPGFGLTLERFGGAAPTPGQIFDRKVYWRYGDQHPVRPSPRLSLRWQPLQDQVGMLSAWAVTNAEWVTLDHVSGQARWTGLLPFHPGARGSVAYQASWRLADLHRGAPYLRHGPKAQVDLSLWHGTEGRLLLYAEDALWLGTPQGLQNTLSVGLRWDWTRGRGLRDFMPFEEELEDRVEGVQ